MDNFERVKGFAPRFGLFRVNYETLERKLTYGAKAYAKWIEEHKEVNEV